MNERERIPVRLPGSQQIVCESFVEGGHLYLSFKQKKRHGENYERFEDLTIEELFYLIIEPYIDPNKRQRLPNLEAVRLGEVPW